MFDVPNFDELKKPSDETTSSEDLLYWTERLCTLTKEDSYFDILEAANGFDEAMKDIKAPPAIDLACRKEVMYTLIDLIGKKETKEIIKNWNNY
jgi:hypothetical protein